jgi:SnoaL-like domain
MIKRYPKTYHVLGQSTYEIDGDVATGEVYCMAHHLTPDPGADPPAGTNYVMFIRYDDEYRAGADGEWRIADRRVLIDWTETRVANPPGR